MELSDRLKAIADMVTHGNSLVDVGCDHGYLPIYLVKKGIIKSAVASDVNKGPLEAARRNIKLYGIDENVIRTRISDGLKNILPGEGESLVIAGMGGALTVKILEESFDTFYSFEEVILQPQSEIEKVRKFVSENGWKISEEDFLKEDGKYYSVMRLVKTSEKVEYSEEELLYGPCLIRIKHTVLFEFLLEKYEKYSIICEGLMNKNSSDARIGQRISELKKEIDSIKRVLDGNYEF